MDSTSRWENCRHEFQVLSAIPRHRNIIRYLRQFEERLTRDIWALLPEEAQQPAWETVYQSPADAPVVKLRRCQFILMELFPMSMETFVTRSPRLSWSDFLPLACDIIAGLRVSDLSYRLAELMFGRLVAQGASPRDCRVHASLLLTT